MSSWKNFLLVSLILGLSISCQKAEERTFEQFPIELSDTPIEEVVRDRKPIANFKLLPGVERKEHSIEQMLANFAFSAWTSDVKDVARVKSRLEETFVISCQKNCKITPKENSHERN